MTAPRAIRAANGQVNEASTRMTFHMVVGRSICSSTMAASTMGMAKKISAMRDTTESSSPPKNPASAPSVPPMNMNSAAAPSPTMTDARAP